MYMQGVCAFSEFLLLSSFAGRRQEHFDIVNGVICEAEKIVGIGASQQTYRVEFSVTRWCEFMEGIGWH